VALEIVDAAGREMKAWSELRELKDHLAGAVDPAAAATVRWKVKVDGQALLLARYPLTVRATVLDVAGHEARATLEVAR
jgi:hypothetical protein